MSDGPSKHSPDEALPMTIKLQSQERELVELTLEDLHHIAKETYPDCDDHQLRRVSVPLRNLLIEDWLVRSWKLLQLQPKSPVIIAPRLRTEGLQPNDFAVAGSGNVAGVAVGNVRIRLGRASSPEELKARYEQEKDDIKHAFSLSDYKESCALYMRGQKISRRQLVQYVANKKGGAHLDNTRKTDEEAYSILDAAIRHACTLTERSALPYRCPGSPSRCRGIFARAPRPQEVRAISQLRSPSRSAAAALRLPARCRRVVRCCSMAETIQSGQRHNGPGPPLAYMPALVSQYSDAP